MWNFILGKLFILSRLISSSSTSPSPCCEDRRFKREAEMVLTPVTSTSFSRGRTGSTGYPWGPSCSPVLKTHVKLPSPLKHPSKGKELVCSSTARMKTTLFLLDPKFNYQLDPVFQHPDTNPGSLAYLHQGNLNHSLSDPSSRTNLPLEMLSRAKMNSISPRFIKAVCWLYADSSTMIRQWITDEEVNFFFKLIFLSYGFIIE